MFAGNFIPPRFGAGKPKPKTLNDVLAARTGKTLDESRELLATQYQRALDLRDEYPPNPTMTKEMQARADELKQRPAKPLPAKPLPIREP